MANSALVKTSWFGGDPNWGRIAQSAGHALIARGGPPALLRVTVDGEDVSAVVRNREEKVGRLLDGLHDPSHRGVQAHPVDSHRDLAVLDRGGREDRIAGASLNGTVAPIASVA